MELMHNSKYVVQDAAENLKVRKRMNASTEQQIKLYLFVILEQI